MQGTGASTQESWERQLLRTVKGIALRRAESKGQLLILELLRLQEKFIQEFEIG